jgi:hypothetical protein
MQTSGLQERGVTTRGWARRNTLACFFCGADRPPLLAPGRCIVPGTLAPSSWARASSASRRAAYCARASSAARCSACTGGRREVHHTHHIHAQAGLLAMLRVCVYEGEGGGGGSGGGAPQGSAGRGPRPSSVHEVLCCAEGAPRAARGPPPSSRSRARTPARTPRAAAEARPPATVV